MRASSSLSNTDKTENKNKFVEEQTENKNKYVEELP